MSYLCILCNNARHVIIYLVVVTIHFYILQISGDKIIDIIRCSPCYGYNW